jgi:hypothetical protein
LYGIFGAAENSFRSYLLDRKEKVEIKSFTATQMVLSRWGRVKHAVHQW